MSEKKTCLKDEAFDAVAVKEKELLKEKREKCYSRETEMKVGETLRDYFFECV